MSFETPEQIDLSQENDVTKLKSVLDPNEIQALDEYLQEGKKGIMLITQQELEQLKTIIAGAGLESLSSDIQSQTISGDINDFMQQQIKEGLSASDIIGGTEILSESDLDALDTQSQEILFGTGGVFEGMNISDQAQDHMSVALTLSIIDHINKHEDFSIQDIKNLILGEGELLKELQNKLEDLKKLVSGFLHMEDDMDANYLNIEGSGEENYIFMQTTEGKEFFHKIFSGEIAGNEIERYIESKNISEGIPNTLTDIQEQSKGNITDIKEKIVSTAEKMTPKEREEVVAESEKSGEELTGIAKWIHDFFKTFIDAFEGLIPEDEDTEGNPNKDEPKEIAPNTLKLNQDYIKGKISQGALTEISESSVTELIDNESDMKKLILLMEDIPAHKGQNTFEEKIDNLLYSNVDSAETIRLDYFIDKIGLNPIKNESDGSLNKENFFAAITSYTNYRKAYDVQPGLTYEQWKENSNE